VTLAQILKVLEIRYALSAFSSGFRAYRHYWGSLGGRLWQSLAGNSAGLGGQTLEAVQALEGRAEVAHLHIAACPEGTLRFCRRMPVNVTASDVRCVERPAVWPTS
jgi:hypothetical protein